MFFFLLQKFNKVLWFLELGQDSSPVTSQGGNSGAGISGAGMVSHIPGRSHASSVSDQNGVTATCQALEKQPAPPGTAGGSLSSQTQLHNFLSGINTQSLGPLLGSTTHKAPANHHSSSVQTSTSVTVSQVAFCFSNFSPQDQKMTKSLRLNENNSLRL